MISVIVPVYQVEEYIQECLNSIIKQTYRDLEILCINDCTLDNSATIVKEFIKRDQRIRLIHHEENRGLGGARNTGIREAKGEYILFVDSDDYIDKNMVEKLHQALTETCSDTAVCGIMLVAPDGSQIPATAFHYDDLAGEKVYNIKTDKELLTNMWPSASNKLFKASVLQENNILFKERILYEDHTFFYEYFMHCDQFAYVKEPLYFYRKQRPLSITSVSFGREKEIFQILSYIHDIFNIMYSSDTAQKLEAKITVRLLYERRWVFHDSDPNYYKYLATVSKYLSAFDRDFLMENKDAFISAEDPIFLSEDGRRDLEKKALRAAAPGRFSLMRAGKESIKKLPLIRRFVSLYQTVAATHSDTIWYGNQLRNDISSLNNRINDIWWATWDNNNKLKRIESIAAQLNRLQTSVYQASFQERKSAGAISSRLDSFHDSLTELKSSFDTQESGALSYQENMEMRLHDLEVTINSLRKKSEETWWLSWNMKDTLDGNMTQGENRILKYYPTWVPCEYPEYFKGNTWYWSDNFKQYNLERKGDCQSELAALFSGMDPESVHLGQCIWERNTRLLPYSEYTDKQCALLKTSEVFTPREIEEQHTIFKTYSDKTAPYLLPENAVYEIPVFYYEHGLVFLNEAQKRYVREGDILDVGAFIGDSALILSNYTQRRVFSVEIDEDNIKTMKKVLYLNHVEDKVQIIHSGVGAADGEFPYRGKSSYSTLSDENKGQLLYQDTQTAKVHTIDSLAETYGIQPHFIKMDIEGLELEAITAAKNTIVKHRPILCISIYHTAKDFLLLKPLLDSWNLGYCFRLENHNPFDPVYEKMLIAIPQTTVC